MSGNAETEKCENCRFWHGKPRTGGEPYSPTGPTPHDCRRYPSRVSKVPDDWCGEWQAALEGCTKRIPVWKPEMLEADWKADTK